MNPQGWDLSTPDWQDRLLSGRSLVPDLPLWESGDKAVRIFNKLRLHDVSGTPNIEDACGDWFRDIVRALFGSLDPATKQRMIREVFTLVPKKNSKTTYGALGFMLTALLMNERPRAPFGMAAPVQDVSELAFEAVAGAIELDPVLDRLLHVRHHLKTIVHRQTKATLEVMTFDPATVTGTKWAGFLVDELHQIAKMSKAANALRQIRGGMIVYPESFLAFITTQSDDAPMGVFKAELDKARAVRDGRKIAPMLPVMYEFPEAMQRDRRKLWQDPKFWRFVTPNAGRSITIQRLEEEFEDAKDKGEEEIRGWASQHLNVEVGLALHANRWPGADHWEAQGDASITLEALLKRCEVVTLGIDGGGLDDLLAVAVVGREEATGEWLQWAHAWAHPIVLKRHQAEADRFRDFEKAGHLTLVENIGEDIGQVAAVVEKCEKSGLLDNVGVDPAGIGLIIDAIVEIEGGFEHDRIVGIPQGWKLVGAIKTTERMLASGTFHHGAAPMMAWCVSNAKSEPRGNAVMITKQGSGSAKIDPLMATFNAVALMAMNPQPRKKKYQMFVV